MRAFFLAASLCTSLSAALTIPSEGQAILSPGFAVPEGYDIDLDAKRLVQFSADDASEPVWMTEREKIVAKAAGKRFFDITDARDLESYAQSSLKKKVEYGPVNATEAVNAVIETLSKAGPQANLEHFTSFRTRYYRSETGRQSQQWLLSKINEITNEYAAPSLKGLVSISEFTHSWGQNSIIVRIKGSNPTKGTVIISAHQDSTNMWPFLPAPGADDDGSGTVTILESYRALIAAGFTPVEDVEFHWYSAEEGGLLGSQAVARDYAARGAKVYAMQQFDMTAWVKKGTREEVGIITDYVDPSLTKFVSELVEAYLSIPFVETKCGYACSDHASWGKAGYPSAFAIESSFENSNHYIHSANDRIDISPEFSFDHMLEYSKLGVALAIELGRWKSA